MNSILENSIKMRNNENEPNSAIKRDPELKETEFLDEKSL